MGKPIDSFKTARPKLVCCTAAVILGLSISEMAYKGSDWNAFVVITQSQRGVQNGLNTSLVIDVNVVIGMSLQFLLLVSSTSLQLSFRCSYH
jgi:hypothetical protein